MTVLKLLLSSIIYIAAMEVANPIDEKRDVIRHSAFNYLINDLSDYIQPLYYEMQLKLNINELIGKYKIIIYIRIATQNVSFHTPSSMRIMNPELKRMKNKMICNLNAIYHENNLTVLSAEDILLSGIYVLYMESRIYINEDFFESMYTNGDKEWLIATGLQPKKLQVFPSWDKPELRITFDISIMHHRKYTALSNMPISVIEPAYDDMVWTYFQQTSFISIDSVAFVVSNFQRNFNFLHNVNVWCRPQLVPYMTFAQSIAESVTMYLEHYWNNSKRVVEWTLLSAQRKVDHIAIPNCHYEVKQTLGFVFYKELDIIYNEELDPVTRKMIIARLITREMAQKYIGNLLSPTYWFHQWLNEGFITFLQAHIIEKAMPEFRMMDLFVVQVQHELLDLNSYLVINSVMEYNNYPENYLFSLSYVKGSIIWRMLKQTLSPDVFSVGIDKYLNNQFSNSKATTSDHLWTAMQTVMNALNPKYHFDVKRMIDSWAIQRYFPVLEVMRKSRDVVTASVQFHDELDEKQYYIPLTYTTESNLNFNVTWSEVWLTPSYSKFEFSLEKDQWIIFNIQQTGYYRVNYDTDNWRRIAQYLNSKEYRNIHVLNRVQIINDAFHFAVEKKLDFSIFWDLAKYLSKEMDYIAWYPMLKIFEFISNIFAFLEFGEFNEFMIKVKKMVPLIYMKWRVFSNASIPMSDDHTKCLEQELAKWGCIIDSTPCKIMANDQLQRHLTNPEQNKFLPGWKKWIYCNGLKVADLDTRNKFVDKIFEEFKYKKNFDLTILECLINSEKPEVIIHYLEETLPKVTPAYMYGLFFFNSEKLKEAKESADALTANIFLSTLAKNTKHMLKDMLKNFRKLKDRRISDIVALTVIINNVYSKKQFNEIYNFLKDEFVETELISAVECKIETRSLEIDRQIKYFQSLFSPLKN